jgi:epoxyqueuosine reductase
LTIEFRGGTEQLPTDLAAGMGNHIFGCDDCLDVCPFNLRAEPTTEQAFHPSATALAARLDELARLDEESFRQRFGDTPVRRAKLTGLRRNVEIARRNE